MQPILPLLLSTIAVVGCGPNVENYDQACSVDSDCAMVFEAHPCSCPFAHAIHVDGHRRWEAARKAVPVVCVEQKLAVCKASFKVPVCDAGTCALEFQDLPDDP